MIKDLLDMLKIMGFVMLGVLVLAFFEHNQETMMAASCFLA